MKITLSLLLILLSFNGGKCQSVESLQTAVQLKPGETLSLSCRGSGFTFSSYDMHWIRQQAGKPLEWIAEVGSSGSNKAKSFDGRAEFTKDDSNRMVYLKLSGVTVEDSAVYYCASETHSEEHGWKDCTKTCPEL
uniref:Ig-like domain-containing protein n=1 Tax=Pygocentrus nattereri TaxID=42514 RepID=A0A3B4BNU8_PYGNA